MQIRSFRGSGEPVWVSAPPSACFRLGPDPRRALGPAATPAASTGRTRDRTRPMLQKRQKALARAPSTRDPNVWSGRASQEVFVELAVAVLHQCIRPLIGAFGAPGHHGYQRACDLISGQASIGPFGSPVFACAGKTEPPSRLILSQTSAGKDCRVTSSRTPDLALFFSRSMIKQAGRSPYRSSLPRSSGPEPEHSRRCGRVYWRARSPARCGAAASSLPRSRA